MILVICMSIACLHNKANPINRMRGPNINKTKVLILKQLKFSRENTMYTNYYKMNDDV